MYVRGRTGPAAAGHHQTTRCTPVGLQEQDTTALGATRHHHLLATHNPAGSVLCSRGTRGFRLPACGDNFPPTSDTARFSSIERALAAARVAVVPGAKALE